jgi:hypothetical protein
VTASPSPLFDQTTNGLPSAKPITRAGFDPTLNCPARLGAVDAEGRAEPRDRYAAAGDGDDLAPRGAIG